MNMQEKDWWVITSVSDLLNASITQTDQASSTKLWDSDWSSNCSYAVDGWAKKSLLELSSIS